MFQDRRQFITSMSAIGLSYYFTPGLFAEELIQTPRLTEGPFYPDKMPLDTDNDLIVVNNSLTPAVGTVTHLSGKITDIKGNPIRNAFIEIWQVDNQGAYLHSGTNNNDNRDKNFQGYGRFLTNNKGEYYFRTIKPVPYPGRTPHIHVGVSRFGKRVFTSQILIKGEPQNERDGVFRQLTDEKLRNLLAVDFKSIPDSKIGELAVNFDIVLGLTPEEDEQGLLKGIGKSERESGMMGGPDGRPGPGGGRPPRGPGGPGGPRPDRPGPDGTGNPPPPNRS